MKFPKHKFKLNDILNANTCEWIEAHKVPKHSKTSDLLLYYVKWFFAEKNTFPPKIIYIFSKCACLRKQAIPNCVYKYVGNHFKTVTKVTQTSDRFRSSATNNSNDGKFSAWKSFFLITTLFQFMWLDSKWVECKIFNLIEFNLIKKLDERFRFFNVVFFMLISTVAKKSLLKNWKSHKMRLFSMCRSRTIQDAGIGFFRKMLFVGLHRVGGPTCDGAGSLWFIQMHFQSSIHFKQKHTDHWSTRKQ